MGILDPHVGGRVSSHLHAPVGTRARWRPLSNPFLAFPSEATGCLHAAPQHLLPGVPVPPRVSTVSVPSRAWALCAEDW